MAVQRFATIEEIDASNPTIEEREKYETPVRLGMTVFAGVDYGEILRQAEAEADVIIWDGGNNDLPFFRPDLLIVVADPLRAGDELRYHPGEANLRMAHVVVLNKLDSTQPEEVERVLADVAAVNPDAAIVRAESPVELEDGSTLAGKRVLAVEDGPTITHGGMPFGARTVAARSAGAKLVDPLPFAVGSLADTFAGYPHIGPALPAMGYSADQRAELEATINAVDCDAVVAGTPFDLRRIIDSRHPVLRASYELRVLREPSLEQVLEPVLA
jgi:predicted GTPase